MHILSYRGAWTYITDSLQRCSHSDSDLKSCSGSDDSIFFHPTKSQESPRPPSLCHHNILYRPHPCCLAQIPLIVIFNGVLCTVGRFIKAFLAREIVTQSQTYYSKPVEWIT